MSKRTRIGLLTPSSNTVLEPLSYRIVENLPEVTVHFARFTVLKIALSDDALAQFDNTKIIEAAKLLADANVDVIGWSGTSAGWLGFSADEKLCADITTATGIPTTTSTLGLNKLITKLNIKNLSLLTPYTDDVQSAIIQNYATLGVTCTRERHLRQSHNAGFAEITEEVLTNQLKELVDEGAKFVSVYCTGLKAAHLVADWEKRYDIVVLDTVATVIWDALLLAGIDVRRVKGWGQIFQCT